MTDPSPPPSESLGYATAGAPRSPAAGPACWRRGEGDASRIVVREGGRTPDRCVRCNRAAGGFAQRMKFWEALPSPGSRTSGGDVAGVADAAVSIVEIATRRSAVVHLAACPACQRRRSIAKVAGGVVALTGLVVLIGGITLLARHPQTQLITGTATIFGGLVVMAVAWFVATGVGALVTFERLERDLLIFKPTGPEFVASLPAWGGDASEPSRSFE